MGPSVQVPGRSRSSVASICLDLAHIGSLWLSWSSGEHGRPQNLFELRNVNWMTCQRVNRDSEQSTSMPTQILCLRYIFSMKSGCNLGLKIKTQIFFFPITFLISDFCFCLLYFIKIWLQKLFLKTGFYFNHPLYELYNGEGLFTINNKSINPMIN